MPKKGGDVGENYLPVIMKCQAAGSGGKTQPDISHDKRADMEAVPTRLQNIFAAVFFVSSAYPC